MASNPVASTRTSSSQNRPFVRTRSESLRDDWGPGGYDYESVTAAGWDMYLSTLDQYLTHLIGKTAAYIGAEAPPPSARREAVGLAWPRLSAWPIPSHWAHRSASTLPALALWRAKLTM